MALTTRERSVYAHVRDCAKRGERATVAETARITGIARSSVARVAQTLGYEGWLDFTTQLVAYYGAARDETAGAVGDSVDAIVQVLQRNRAHTILIDAIGDPEICMSYLLVRLNELGFRAAQFSQGMLERCKPSSHGALLVLNESGMALLPACVLASEKGFDVVAITASHDTPISKVATVNVMIKNNKSSISEYKPNYFTAGSLALLERVLSTLSADDDPYAPIDLDLFGKESVVR